MSAPLPAIEELSARAQWVAWRIEQTADGKLTKVPYVAANGKHADSTDPATWTEYAIAAQVHKAAGHRGLGFVVTLDDPYCGIDLDHCRDPATREIAPWAIAIVKRFDSYVEISPSQTGLRIWIKARKSGAKCQKPMGYGKVEVYDHARFFTVTGEHLEGTPTTIEDRQAESDALYAELWPEQPTANGSGKPSSASSLTAYEILELARQHRKAAKWDRLMRGDLSEYNGDDSRADGALCALAAFYTDDPSVIDQIVRMSGLCRPKWTERLDYRQRTISGAVQLVKERYEPPSASQLRHSGSEGDGGPGDDAPSPSTGWEPAELKAYLTGARPPRPAPSMLQRADGINLLYDGKLHWISGEPEGLKSWLAQIAVGDAIMLGLNALYVDFEADAESVIDRLLALGCTPEAILGHLSYHRPEVGVGRRGDDTADVLLATAKARRPAISVIDGVQASMGLDDLDSNSARDFYHWWGSFGRPLLKLTSGPTIAVDHVVKLSENRKQYAAGTGQKQAAVDVHIGTEILEPFGVGLTGRAALTLQKDRPGMLQRHAGKRIDGRAPLATLTMQSFGELGGIRFALEPNDGKAAGFRPTVYMERVSRYVEITGAGGITQSRTNIEKNVSGKAEYIRQAIVVLVDEGFLQMTPGRVVAGAQTATYINVREYREATDPLKSVDRGTVLRTAGEVVI